MFGLLITKDPKTGEPLDIPGGTGLGLILLVCPSTSNEREKDYVAMVAQSVAVCGGAVACVTVFEAWVAAMPPDQLLKVAPSKHPDRVEALILMVEREDGKGRMERTIFRRDQGQLVFDEPDGGDIPLSDMTGRFAILPRQKVGADTVETMRAFVRHVDVRWEKVA